MRGRLDAQAGGADWSRLCERAAGRLIRRLKHSGELTPMQVACTVTSVLPPAGRAWLLGRLSALGWLSPTARLAFDLFESDGCPREFRGPERELVRLAVFGVRGEGRPDFKHREAVYQTICAQITRDSGDLNRLSGAATRALSHPDVCRDPVLAAMVRSFVTEQEAALRTQQRVGHPEPEDDSQLQKPFEGVGGLDFPTRAQIHKAFLNLQREFEVHLAQYNEAAARYALEKMQELGRRFPVHMDEAAVAGHEQQFADFLERCALFRRQIEDLAKQAAGAARTGEQKMASWLLRRLRAIHALTPVLLSAERFEKLREEIEHSGEEHEHREAVRELIAREQEVAAEIKKAGGVIYRFQRLARTASPDSEEHRRAEADYREAVNAVRSRDTEWLTGLLLELETYLEDLNDPEDRAQERLDRFIGTVRSALTQLRREIRAIQAERARGAGPPDSAEGSDAAPPG